jgi:shikimate dehydrogenase
MEKKQDEIHWYGLLGRNISYSFSRGYFAEKFERLNRSDCRYINFDLDDIHQLPDILEQYQNLKGFNVTIPYKEAIIPYLDKLSDSAKAIGAVNCVQVTSQGLVGYNTDAYGFQKALEPFLQANHKKALILGTGGASKAVVFALNQLDISSTLVSRTPVEGQITYDDLDANLLQEIDIIVNSTPLGTHPNVEAFPPVPFEYISNKHLVIDLIYNPVKTTLLQKCEARGASISNGYDMLVHQAEKSWEIWNSDSEL